MMRLAGILILIVLVAVHPQGVCAGTPDIPAEDYALYDDVVIKKFLTSRMQMLVIERMTLPLSVEHQKGPMTVALFQQQEFFHNALPLDLVQHFVGVNREPGRLEGRFHFGVRYRFISGEKIEEPEVSLALPVRGDRMGLSQGATGSDQLAFSRIGRNLRNDQALVYVANLRADGSGAGFLMWFRQLGQGWRIFSTEVIWVIASQGDAEEPPLAP
jgi:hypothetical protein